MDTTTKSGFNIRLQEITKAFVASEGPIKATELAVLVASSEEGSRINRADHISDVIDQLVWAGEIIEVEYVLPHMNYRCKSMLFPAGTKVRIVNSKPPDV